LIVEIDGESHDQKGETDEIRDKVMKELGYKVIRVTEKEVMSDLPNVIRTTEAFLPEDILSLQSPNILFKGGQREVG
jgi:5-methyltetrahydrofolate--homocysteine methyltransferase